MLYRRPWELQPGTYKMKLTINLSTRIYIDKKRLRIISGLFIIVLLALLGIEVKNISGKISEINRIKGEIASLEIKDRTASIAISESDYKKVLARVGFANAIIAQKN